MEHVAKPANGELAAILNERHSRSVVASAFDSSIVARLPRNATVAREPYALSGKSIWLHQ